MMDSTDDIFSSDSSQPGSSEEVISSLAVLSAGKISSAELDFTTNPELLRNLMASDDSLRAIASREFDQRYRQYILLAARKTGASEQEAWDVMDMVRGRVLREIAKYDKAKGSFRNWLWTMTRNLAINEIQKRRSHETRLGTDTELGIECFEREWLLEDLRHQVKIAIAQLYRHRGIDQKRLEIFCEYALGKRRAAEVARQFDVSENAVRLTKHELMEPFREALATAIAEESGI